MPGNENECVHVPIASYGPCPPKTILYGEVNALWPSKIIMPHACLVFGHTLIVSLWQDHGCTATLVAMDTSSLSQILHYLHDH